MNLDEDFDIDCQDIYKINFSTYEIDRVTNSPYNESYPIELNSENLYIFPMNLNTKYIYTKRP